MRRPGERNDTGAVLRHYHRSRIDDPIAGADEFGIFRESQLAILSGDALPIVVDTNVLLRDLENRCKRGHRTTLISGANMRALRLYCTPHVVNEVYEKIAWWTEYRRIERTTFLAAWQNEYIPLLRCTPADGLEEMLLPNERGRIDALRHEDNDDVPAAIVAIAMGGLFLTEDKPAREAVYGAGQDPKVINDWLDTLRAGTDAAVLEEMMHVAFAIPTFGVFAVAKGAESLHARSRLAFWVALAATAGAVGGSLFFLSKGKLEEVWDFVRGSATLFGERIMLPHLEKDMRVSTALPPFPEWDGLVDTASRDAALARACLYKLVRARPSPKNAAEIAKILPSLNIGQKAPRIGKVLRRYAIFHEGKRGEWQSGFPIPGGPMRCESFKD